MKKELRDYMESLIKKSQMDPAMMGGAPPPMDPAMMGGAPPMDPAMMGGAPPPMDPAMMGAPMPADPSMAMGVPGGGLPPELMAMMSGLPAGLPENEAIQEEPDQDAVNKALDIADTALQLVKDQSDQIEAATGMAAEESVDPEVAAAIEEAKAEAMGEM